MDIDLKELRKRIEHVRYDGFKRFSIEITELTALLDCLERAEADAERYQWLRDDPPVELSVRRFPGDTERGCYLDGVDLDRAIDSAIAASKKED